MGCSLKKILVDPPKKSEYSEKNKKIQGFFWGFKIRLPYLGVNNSSNLVLKSFFIYKILVHKKRVSKNQKITKKSKNFFFEDLKSVQLIWEWTTPRFQYLNPFLIYKNLVHPKKSGNKSEKNPKNRKKTEINSMNPSIFLRLFLRTVLPICEWTTPRWWACVTFSWNWFDSTRYVGESNAAIHS